VSRRDDEERLAVNHGTARVLDDYQERAAMTSLILENSDLNRLFPKCRPRLDSGPIRGSLSNHQQHEQQEEQQQKQEQRCYERNLPTDMIDLECDSTDR
jgi:hypothetical protein